MLRRRPRATRNDTRVPYTTRVRSLSLATSESWRDRNSGERRERTEWHRVVIFNEKLCEVAEKYLRKGSKIYVEGALQTRKWTDQSGVEKYSRSEEHTSELQSLMRISYAVFCVKKQTTRHTQ